MAIIVDKVQKRKDIALSCKELVFQNGIHNLTIAQIAKTAGVGKGTIYDYFKNKEDIVFEIINIMIRERNIILKSKLETISSTKEKIKLFGYFFYSEEDRELRQLYKEFISISLSTPDERMIDFQTQCFEGYYSWFEKIIDDAIANDEIVPLARKLIRGLFVFGEGIFIASETTTIIKDMQQEIENYTDVIFELIEVKNNV